MDALTERAYQKLVSNLEELTKFYRQLLDLVRKEKEILLGSRIQDLEENNQMKDQLMLKIHLADALRLKHANELATLVRTDVESPRLLDLALRMPQAEGDRLRSIHATLDLVIRRLVELNKENETYAQSALMTLNGAMGDIKETLAGKKTYEKKGQYKLGPDQAGNFVRKEV